MLRYALKDRRGNLAALMQTYCRIKDDCDRNCGIIHRRKSGERGDIFRMRISTRGWINFCAVPVFPAEL